MTETASDQTGTSAAIRHRRFFQRRQLRARRRRADRVRPAGRRRDPRRARRLVPAQRPEPAQPRRALVHWRRHDPRRPRRGRPRRRGTATGGSAPTASSKTFPLYNADGTRNLRASVANTHVVNHAGKTLALVESSLPYEITNDLETVGAYDFGGKLVDSMTAHPKICPTTGEMHFFGYGNIFAPHVTYHRADADGELVINRPLEVKALTMMHDFALTANHVVFMDLPIVFNLDIAMSGSGDMPYRWDDYVRCPARRAAPRRPVRRGAVVRDRPLLRVPRRQCLRLRQSERWSRQRGAAGGSVSRIVARQRWIRRRRDVLWTWTVDLKHGTVTERQLDDRVVEFPRIDDRLADTSCALLRCPSATTAWSATTSNR